MFLGIGVYAADSAVFHLFTHAFFKALLFLGAGSVMHAMGGIIDIRKFGGLRRILPWTFATFLIGSLALAGFPMLSGFFSKDEIINEALKQSTVLGFVGLLTALLTAFYTFRMVFLAFFGKERIPEGVHPHESGKWMLMPLLVLSVGAIGAGYLGTHATGQPFHKFLEPVFADTFAVHGEHSEHSEQGEQGEQGAEPGGEHGSAYETLAVSHDDSDTALHSDNAAITAAVVEAGAHGGNPGHANDFWADYGLMVVSGFLAVFGIVGAFLLYVDQTWIPSLVKESAPRWHQVLWRKWYVDELYEATLVEPARKAGKVCVGLDDYLIDGLLWVITAIPRGLGYVLRTMQTGAMQSYGLSMVLGIAVIVLIVLW
jgi:NADH-quinone oxidoreductase subunit L